MNEGIKLGQITEESLALLAEAPIVDKRTGQRLPTSARKDITVGTDPGLYGYSLESVVRSLYPIEDAVRRLYPRTVNPVGAPYAHWKTITAINTAGVKPGVAEGLLNDYISLQDQDVYVKYSTLNMAGRYTQEAMQMARGLDNTPQRTMLTTLQSLMMAEDRELIGGTMFKIGKPTGGAAAAGTGTLSSTVYFRVSALTLFGYLNQVKGKTIGDADNADETDPSDVITGTGASTSGYLLTWTAVKGAVAYNIYAGSANTTNSITFLKTVTTNKVNIADLTGLGAKIPNAADKTADLLGYNGSLNQIVGLIAADNTYATSGAYIKSLDGEKMSADNATGVAEIDSMLESLWNYGRIGPTHLLCHAQETRSLKALMIGTSGSNVTRVMVPAGDQHAFSGGAAVTEYWNPFTSQIIKVVTSIHMPPGTILALGMNVPYPDANIAGNFEVDLQQEYYGEEFARIDRRYPVGVTCIGALKLYYPPACGVISNIAPTIAADVTPSPVASLEAPSALSKKSKKAD